MAFTLSLATPTVSNDATQMTFTDASNWGSPNYSYPNGTTSWLKLSLLAQTYNGQTQFDDITSAAFFNNYDQANLAYFLTADLLKVGGNPMYSSGDALPDALYTATYTLTNTTGTLATYQVAFLNPQQVKIDTYNDFAKTPYLWDKQQIDMTTTDMRALLEPLRKLTLLRAMYLSPYQSNESKMLLNLEILTRLIDNLQQ